MQRFKSAGDFVSYCRLCSTSKLSNGKSKGLGNAKNGNAYLSWAFTEVAQYASRNPVIREILQRLLRKYGGLRVKAIRTLAAKIARVRRVQDRGHLCGDGSGAPAAGQEAKGEQPGPEGTQ